MNNSKQTYRIKYDTLGEFPYNILTNITIVIIYYFLAKLGVYMSVLTGNVSLIWPPMGFTLAIVLIAGYRVLPGVFFGGALSSFLGFFNINDPLSLTAIGIGVGSGVGSTLSAATGAHFIRKYCKTTNPLFSIKNVIAFIVFGALAAQLISTLFGVLTYMLADVITNDMLYHTVTAWWTGDIVGVLIFAPLFIVFFHESLVGLFNVRLFEGLAFLLVLTFVSFYSLDLWPYSKPVYITFFSIAPIIFWGSFRLDQRITLTGTLLVSLIAIIATLNDRGPFVGDVLGRPLIELQSFLMVLVLTTLVLNAVIAESRRTRENLTLSEEKYKMIVENTSEGLMYVSIQGIIQFVNDRFCNITGYDREDLVGNNAELILKPGQKFQRKKRYANKHTMTEESVQYEVEILRKHEDVSWVHVISTQISDSSGLVTGYVEIFTDITEKKRAQEE